MTIHPGERVCTYSRSIVGTLVSVDRHWATIQRDDGLFAKVKPDNVRRVPAIFKPRNRAEDVTARKLYEAPPPGARKMQLPPLENFYAVASIRRGEIEWSGDCIATAAACLNVGTCWAGGSTQKQAERLALSRAEWFRGRRDAA